MPDYEFEREVNKEELLKELQDRLGITPTMKTIGKKCIVTATLTATQEQQLKRIMINHNPDFDYAAKKVIKKFSKENLMKSLYDDIEFDASLSANFRNYLKRIIEIL